MVTPFAVDISERERSELYERVSRTRWSPPLAPADWTFGVSRAYIQALTSYWVNAFDWRSTERQLNALPQYRYSSPAGGVHVVHARTAADAAWPVLITPGWPSTFREFARLIPLLTEPVPGKNGRSIGFDVVIPSIPGYGFSDMPRQPGMNVFAIGDLWADLMTALGYERFLAQGGDWGASIATALAYRHPHRVRAIHLNYIPQSYLPQLAPGDQYSNAETAFIRDRDRWAAEHGAYAHVQRTQPDTLAYALNDSPIGLAAWLIDKFRTWSDCDGEVESRFTADDLLATVSIYWFTQTIGSSSRLYFEHARAPLVHLRRENLPMPVGVARFSKEAPFPPREWVERLYNVAHWTEVPRGGHFPAWEEPRALADDIREFAASLVDPR